MRCHRLPSEHAYRDAPITASPISETTCASKNPTSSPGAAQVHNMPRRRSILAMTRPPAKMASRTRIASLNICGLLSVDRAQRVWLADWEDRDAILDAGLGYGALYCSGDRGRREVVHAADVACSCPAAADCLKASWRLDRQLHLDRDGVALRGDERQIRPVERPATAR